MRIGAICGECRKYYQGEVCPNCRKTESGKTVNFIMDFHDSYYDHGLGTVVKSRQHRKAIMKDKGVEEIGTEKNYMHDREVKRASERARETENLTKEAHQLWNSLN